MAPLRLRVATWNCLADSYVHPKTFHYVDRSVLAWVARAPRVVAELARMRADVLLLQEVDRVEEAVGPFLRGAGYEWVFVRRPGAKRDGCLVAWRARALRAVPLPPGVRGAREETGAMEVQLDELAGRQALAQDRERFAKGNVAAAVALEPADDGGGPLLLVCCAHLYWNFRHRDVKLLQAHEVLARVGEAARALEEAGGGRAPAVLLGGDLNATPGSEVMRYALSGVHEPAPARGLLSHRRLLVDSCLRRLGSMLRAVGCDTLVFPAELEEPTFGALFAAARAGAGRVLVTASPRAARRRGCPPCVVINARRPPRDQLREFVAATGLRFRAGLFYTRCLVCNCPFRAMPAAEALAHPSLPPQLRGGDGRDDAGVPFSFYRCGECDTVKWWGHQSWRSMVEYAAVFGVGVEGAGADPGAGAGSPPLGWETARGAVELLRGVDEEQADEAEDAVVVPPDEDERHRPVRERLEHGLRLRSAFAEAHGGEEPSFTNLTSRFAGCLDYVLVDARFRVLSAPEPSMTEAEARSHVGLPNASWPSDHLAVVVDVEVGGDLRVG